DDMIGGSLKALGSQTYKNLEIILVNDGSNEKTKAILENAIRDDKRVHVFHFDERKGVGAARNFGLGKATGEYIYFLDSDDYLSEQTLELLVRHIKDHQDRKSTRLNSSNASIS